MNKTLLGVLISIGVLGVVAGTGFYFYNQGRATVKQDTTQQPTTTQTCTGTPVVTAFTASATEITSGGSATLSWEVANADYVEIDNSIGKVDAKSSIEVKPTALTTYTLTAVCGSVAVKSSVIIKIAAVVPTTKTFNEKYFSIKTRLGWEETTPKESGIFSHRYSYQDNSGNFFEVNIMNPNYEGGLFGGDYLWLIKPNPAKDGVTIVTEEKECPDPSGYNDRYCNNTQRLDIHALQKDKTGPGSYAPPTIKGNDYYFQFGNTKKEKGVDLQVFRDILKSFRAK